MRRAETQCSVANPVCGGGAICVAVAALLFAGPGDFASLGEETVLNFNYNFTSETGTITTVPNPIGEISFSPLTLVEASRRNTIYEPIFDPKPYTFYGPFTRGNHLSGTSYMTVSVFAPSGYELIADITTISVNQSSNIRRLREEISTDYAAFQEIKLVPESQAVPPFIPGDTLLHSGS
jgi:hypothetical protein